MQYYGTFAVLLQYISLQIHNIHNMIKDILNNEQPVQLVVNFQDLKRLLEEVTNESKHHQQLVERVSEPIPEEVQERFLNRRDLAELLHKDPSTIWRWHKRGLLKGYKNGNKYVYKVSEVQKFIEEYGIITQ